MVFVQSLVAASFAASALAAIAPTFEPAAQTPFSQSANYTGPSNGTITNSPLVPGKAFDRFIQIWLENTDFETAASSSVFQDLAKQGVLLDSFYGVTHPSEPNYLAATGGSFWGLGGDDFDNVPANISTIVDLLEAKNISWSSYQENMPYDGYTGFNYTSNDYLSGNGTYTYYVRKHNPLIIYDSVGNVTERALRIRNWNDFAVDVNNSAISQWTFITPNLVNDAHDTTIQFTSDFLSFWLVPLLNDERFNNNRTLILLTFDENETYTIDNRIYTLLLGGVIPEHLKGTTDSNFYTHYSALSTVQSNWGLGCLGRQDTNTTVNNVFDFVANVTGYKNNGFVANDSRIPALNETGDIPGPLNPQFYIPFPAPDTSATCVGGGSVFVASSINTSLTVNTLPSPVNLTASNETLPWSGNGGFDYPNGTKSLAPAPTSTGSGSSSGAEKLAVPAVALLGAAVMGALVL